MNPTIQASDARGVVATPERPAMNGFKHGLRSASVLVPGEDAGEFEALRSDLLRMYRPCTREEQRCVNRIAACQWRVDRYTRFGKVFDAKLDALLEDDTGTVAQHCDPDPHRWQHRADDCGRQEGRFDRMMHRAERRLLELQRLRRNGLLAPGDRNLDADDARKPEALAAVAQTAGQPAETESPDSKPQAGGHEPGTPVTASPDKETTKYNDRECAAVPVSAIPSHRPRTEAPLRLAAAAQGVDPWEVPSIPKVAGVTG